MISNEDIKNYLRDLFYIEEEILGELKKAQTHPSATKFQEEFEQMRQNAIKKQVIITKIIDLYTNKPNAPIQKQH